jgi:hypothetical protein
MRQAWRTPGRDHLGCQTADANGRPTTAPPAGGPGTSFRGHRATRCARRQVLETMYRATTGSALGRGRVRCQTIDANSTPTTARDVRACHFRRFCGLSLPSRLHAWSQTSSEVATAGSALGRGRVECQASEANGSPMTARPCGRAGYIVSRPPRHAMRQTPGPRNDVPGNHGKRAGE